MLTHIKVTANDVIDNTIENGTFIFCKELGKGFIKRDFSPLNLTNYTVGNIITAIETLDYNTLVTKGMDRVLFDMGIMTHSERTQKYVDAVLLPPLSTPTEKNASAANLLTKRKYFTFVPVEEVIINPTNVTVSNNLPTKPSAVTGSNGVCFQYPAAYATGWNIKRPNNSFAPYGVDAAFLLDAQPQRAIYFYQVGNVVNGPCDVKLGFMFDSAKVITSISFGSLYYSTRYVEDFEFQASNNTTDGLDGTWTTLSVVTGLTDWWSGHNTKVFEFANNTTFKSYRLHVTKGYDYLDIANLKFME